MTSKSFEARIANLPTAGEKVVPLHGVQGDEETVLPGADAAYQAAARAASKPLTRLVLCMGQSGFKPGGKPYHFFQYVHLDSNADFGFDDKGQQVLTFRFAGMTPVNVSVHGRNLLQIMDYLQAHRMAWLRVADRDFAPADAVDEDGKPRAFINRILIADARTGAVLAGA